MAPVVLVSKLYCWHDDDYYNEMLNFLLSLYLFQDYFNGAVHIFRTFSQYFWKEVQIISPPFLPPLDGRTARTVTNSQLNFGIAVDIDAVTDVIVVGANAYCK